MAWELKFRYIVTINRTKKYFLAVKENVATGDLQIYLRGKRRRSGLIGGEEPIIYVSTTGEKVLRVIRSPFTTTRGRPFKRSQLTENTISIGRHRKNRSHTF
jgi:hypothetical protein